jgi:pilus assembly protein FimV
MRIVVTLAACALAGACMREGKPEPPRTEAPPATEAPAMEEFDALPPLPGDDHVPPVADDDATVVRPHFDTPAEIPGDDDDATVVRSGAGFGDDAVDTKLDLARAYIDMGDPDGARAMLEEVMSEGSQMQKDVAQKLLDEMG